jgi:hypothetical protein
MFSLGQTRTRMMMRQRRQQLKMKDDEKDVFVIQVDSKIHDEHEDWNEA